MIDVGTQVDGSPGSGPRRTSKRSRKGTVDDVFLESITGRLRDGKPIRRTLQPWGRVHVDRPLPFLVVYRRPQRPDADMASLVVGEAAYVIATGERRERAAVAALVEGIAQVGVEDFGGFLIVEVWSTPETELPPDAPGWTPGFRIAQTRRRRLSATASALEDALDEIRVKGENATVASVTVASVHPPGLPALMSPDRAEALGVHVLGLEVNPVFRDRDQVETYPLVHRALHKGMSRALKRAVYQFTRARTSHRPANYHALGRHSVVKAVWEVDRRLAQVSNQFDFILQVTPTNAEEAWAEFRRRRFEVTPEFASRPLKLDTSLAKRELYRIPIERIEDPTLDQLFRDQQTSLDRRLTMLGDRGTPQFLYGSLQLFGGVDETLLNLAYEVLNRVPSRSRDESPRGAADALAFAVRAEAELAHYRQVLPDLGNGVEIRDDITGVMVSRGRVLVGARIKVPASRMDALVAHEVGTHIVTYVNGRAQPFRQLAIGLPGYDELQEGFAVLSEYLAGGFSRPRLRLLAARVLAARRMLDGADFVEVFRELDRAHDFAQRTAFAVTMRVFRGGGLTKDVVYLRGLAGVLAYLRAGGTLEPLLVGKLGLDHIPIIDELRWRKVLKPPPLRPRHLDGPEAELRLDRIRRGASVLDLVTKERR